MGLTPDEYAKAFCGKSLVSSGELEGICGRFIHEINPEDMSLLSSPPAGAPMYYKRLSWICGSELLSSVLGKTAAEAMVHIGISVEWMKKRLYNGTQYQLVIFPNSLVTLATWDELFSLIQKHYPSGVYSKLFPFFESLKSKIYAEIDPNYRLKEIADSPHEQPEFLTEIAFLNLTDDETTLYHARGFFYHSVGCNLHFQGTGKNLDGQAEYLALNRLIKEIEGAAIIELTVSAEDIDAIQK